MPNMIYCQKLKKDALALTMPPMPGPLGQKIMAEISAEAWKMWIAHQTMLINEYRLVVTESNARNFLKKEMEKFLFGDGSEKPMGYVAV
jgi:Fe-S cluster biosynthesis and repair protein YggX